MSALAGRVGTVSRASARRRPPLGAAAGGAGLALWLSLIVLLPLAAVLAASLAGGPAAFWHAATGAEARAALTLTFVLSALAAAVSAVMGTVLAWMLVRDSFPGKRLLEAIVDLPFALPTIIAGLTLLALYGRQSPLGIDIAFTRAGIFVALLFVTLPFVVRQVMPVLGALDREAEDAAASLGARPRTVVTRVVLPALRPAILSGSALAFARAIGEFGAVVLIAGNIQYKTEYASVFIFGRIETDDRQAAAAVAVVLLGVSLVVLLILEAAERRTASRVG